MIVFCSGLEFQFLSSPTHSRVSSRSTRFTFYVPNPPSSLGYSTYPAVKGALSFVDNFRTYSGANQDSYSKHVVFHSPKSSDRAGRLTAIQHLVQSLNFKKPCVLYIGRAYRCPPNVGFYIFFFNKYKYWLF
jgi:hypothetical protein